jgi:streptogramin lyase/predicted Ser/Thr protein kinase
MSATDLAVGGEILGYRLDELVGRGGMGVVYRAYDRRLKRSVALKLVAPERAADDHFRERFLAESELAAALEHPNVVPIYDAGEVDGHLYLVMRYVEGRDLKTLLREQGSLEAARALAICIQLADALDAAHERGLVHRDVKPSNVLLDERERAYLTDFGLSRRLADQAPGLPATQSLGTPAYVAPEQIRGDQADGRADEYSLACVLYEALSGEPLFRRESELGVLWAHVEEEPPTLPELEEVLAKGLAKDPENRFASCTDFVEAARRALGIAQPTLPSQLRLPVLLGLAGLVLVAAALATYFAVRGGGEPHARRDTLVRIDPATNKVVESIPVGPRASSVAFGDGYLWVTDREERTLWRVDPETGATRATKVTGGPPLDVAVRNGLAAVTYGPVPVGLELIDTASGASEWTYRLPGADDAPAPVAAGADGIWVAASGFAGENVGLVTRAPAASGSPGAIDRVSIPEDPNFIFFYTPDSGSYNDVAVGNGDLWLARDTGPVLKRVDTKQWRVAATIELPFRPKSVAVGAGAVWVTGILDDAVARIDPETTRVTLTVRLPPGTDGVAVAGGSVWVASTIAGTVTRIDPRTGEILATIHVGPRPEDVAVGARGIWVTTHTA